MPLLVIQLLYFSPSCIRSLLFYEHYKLYWYTHNILTMHTVIYENGNQVLANYSYFQWRIHCYCPMPGEEKEGNLV